MYGYFNKSLNQRINMRGRLVTDKKTDKPFIYLLIQHIPYYYLF